MRPILIALIASATLSLPVMAQQPNQQASQQTHPSEQQDRSEVRQVQKTLDHKGFKVGTEDGILGPRTEAALRDFQKQQKIEQSGQLDNRTLAALGINQAQSGNQGDASATAKPQSQSGSRGQAPSQPSSRK